MRVTPSLVLLFQCIHADIIDSNYNLYADRAGVGDVLVEVANVKSVTSCAGECSALDDCTSANYSNNTCTLMHVQDPLDDWYDAHGAIYMCKNHEVDFTASVGFWKFINEASNLRNASAVVTTYNTPFVPAVSGGPDVISFLGHRDSYIVLENNGDLAVSSFTWAAKIFPESTADGPLFNWYLESGCGAHVHHIWMPAGKLLFGLCDGVALHNARYPTAMAPGMWHDVAVSYDATTGATQIRVDGVTSAFTKPAVSGVNGGPVVIGSRYYHSGNMYDNRAFQGKMACVRLWKVARDLLTLRMASPMCQIDA